MSKLLPVLALLMMLLIPELSLAADASSLGPSTTDQAGSSSTSTGNVLQPAAPSPQAADAKAGGLNQAATQDLQQTGPADQAKLLIQGEADSPKSLNDDAGPSLAITTAVVVGLVALVLAAGWLWRRYRT